MANIESNLDLISVNQSQKEVTANELFNSASQAMLYGRRASLSSGLDFAYYGGNIVASDNSVIAVANGSVELDPSDTNYIVAEKATGVVSASTTDTNWNSGDYWRLYLCETGTLTVTDYTDYRVLGEMTSTSGGGGGTPAGGTKGMALVKNSSTDGDVVWSYAIGEDALANNTGSGNSAYGYICLYNNVGGQENSAYGEGAMYYNVSGNYNAAFGRYALNNNVSGSNNTAIGNFAAYLNTASNNTAIGNGALYNCTTGSNNIMISTSSIGPVFNVTTEQNRVVVGRSNVTNAYIQVAWTVVSDGRDKTNIAPIPHGLEFIERLNPVSFQFRESRDSEKPHGNKRYGFIAQEILEIEFETGDPVIIDDEDEDKLKYNGESLVPVLVKAVQEQMAIIRKLQEDIAFLKSK